MKSARLITLLFGFAVAVASPVHSASTEATANDRASPQAAEKKSAGSRFKQGQASGTGYLPWSVWCKQQNSCHIPDDPRRGRKGWCVHQQNKPPECATLNPDNGPGFYVPWQLWCKQRNACHVPDDPKKGKKAWCLHEQNRPPECATINANNTQGDGFYLPWPVWCKQQNSCHIPDDPRRGKKGWCVHQQNKPPECISINPDNAQGPGFYVPWQLWCKQQNSCHKPDDPVRGKKAWCQSEQNKPPECASINSGGTP